MKRVLALAFLASTAAASATAQSKLEGLIDNIKTESFNHMDVGVTLGTTGLGVDVSTPVGDYMQLRAGASFMPHFHHDMHFDVQLGDTKESKYDANGNRVTTKFDRLSEKLEEVTGYKANDVVTMVGEPTYYNAKLLLDVFPLRDKHWHVTAGFYWGNSTIGKAYNRTEEMPSLLAMQIYNRIYDKTVADEPIFTTSSSEFYLSDLLREYGMYDRFEGYGRMGIHVGDKCSDGSHYMMEPGVDGMVKAKVKANSFKPYLGVGYEGPLTKKSDKYSLLVDAGVMFWGGTPRIPTHDGTDLAKDVTNIGGKVGTYVDLIKTFKVFPVIEVRFARKLF